MSEQPGSGTAGRSRGHRVLLVGTFLYVLVLAAATISELLDLGWFDWIALYP